MASRGKQTLVQRIILEGGEVIRKELESLGSEGKKAFEALEKRANEASKATTGWGKSLQVLKGRLEEFSKGAKRAGEGLKDIGSGTKILTRNVALLASAVTATGTALFFLAKQGAAAADAQGKAAQSTGLSIEQYGRLQFAFEQGDVSAEQFATAMKTLNTHMVEAKEGSGAGAKTFKTLGISVLGANGQLKSADVVIREIADKFKALPDGAEKSALAVQLFGKAGALMIPALNEGSKAIVQLGDDAVRTGQVFTEAQAKIGQEFNDNFNEMILTIQRLKEAFGLLFAPAFAEGFKGITEAITANRQNILEFGKTIADQVVPFIKDFFAILRGDDSAVANKGLLQLRDTLVGLVTAVQIFGQVFRFIWDSLVATIDPVVQLINAIFGTKFRSDVALMVVLVGIVTGTFRGFGLVIKGLYKIFEGLKIAIGVSGAAIAALGAGILLFRGTVLTALSRLADAWASWTGQLQKAFDDLMSYISDLFKTFAENALGWLKPVYDFVVSLIAKAQEAGGALLNAIGLGGGSAAEPQANAKGGLIRGRGTGTSDSILSWLSNGEYVIPAKAVRKLGVGVLNTLKHGKLPAFAGGGLVSALSPVGFPGFGPMPQLAAVAANSGRPVNIHFGNDIIEGLFAPEVVVSKLVSYAGKQAVRSAGRKPSWYSGK